MCEWHDVFQPIFQVDKDLKPSVDHYEMLLRDQNANSLSMISLELLELRKIISNGFKLNLKH